MIDKFKSWYRRVMPWYDVKVEEAREVESRLVIRRARGALTEVNLLLSSYRAADVATTNYRHRELALKKRF
jgi:hypothetical protein